MSVEKDIRYELLARLCPNSTGATDWLCCFASCVSIQQQCTRSSRFSGAEIRSVCTEAGMFAIRSRRKMCTEKDFLDAINKVIKAYAKFSATPRYMTYN